MAKGAKKQQLQSQTTTQAAPPSYAQPYVNDIMGRAQNVSYQPYQPYGGNRIAGFTDAEKTARTGIMGLQAPTQFNTATEMATKAGNYTPGTFDGGYDQAKFTGDYATGQFDNTYKPTQFTGGDYATGQFNTNSFNDSGMASQYMSPYMQNVVDVQKRKAREDAQQSQLAGNLGASRQGTTGGSRQLLATLNRERNLATQMGDLQAKGSQDAYTAGMDQYRDEANRRLQAQQYGEQSRQFGSTRQLQEQQERERANQFGANFGMDTQKQREQSRQFGADQRSRAEEAAARERQFGANYRMDARKLGEDSRQFGARQGLDAANQLNQLGTSQQDSDLRRYGAMSAVGEGERDLRQKGLDMQYRDFTDQRDYEKNQLRDYSDIVGAQPSGNITESVYGQPANQTGALIGAAGSIGSAYMMSKYGNSPGYNVGAGMSGDPDMMRQYNPATVLPRQQLNSPNYGSSMAAGGEIYSYNSGGLVALADGGGVDAGKQQGLAALAGGNDGSKYKLKNDPKELLYSTMGDPAKLQALTQQGIDPTAVGIAAMLAKRIYDTQSMAMSPQQTTVAGLLNPQPPQPQGQPQQPQGQMQGQPQGQPQDQQGLAGIAPQGQPMGDPMQPPIDPMQAQGLEALAQQDQPMEEQPIEEPMMAANGGLMNINLPDDYYDEDSYAHGGIAHFYEGDEVVGKYKNTMYGIQSEELARKKREENREETRARYLLMQQIMEKTGGSSSINASDLPNESINELSSLTTEQLKNIANYAGPVAGNGIDKPINIKGLGEAANSFLRPANPDADITGRSMMPSGTSLEASYKEDPISPYDFSLPPQLMGNRSSNPYAEIEALINSNSTAQSEQTTPTKARSLKDYMDESRGLMPKSPVEEEYKAQMLADQNKSNPNRDNWETAGKVFARMTEAANTPGATLIGSAATGLAGLPEDMAATRKSNEQRQKQNLIDRYSIEKEKREEARSNIRDALARQGNDEKIARAEVRFKQEDLIKYREMMMELGMRNADNEAENYRTDQTIAANWLNNRMSATEEARKDQIKFIRGNVTDKNKQRDELEQMDKQFDFDMRRTRYAAQLQEIYGGSADRYADAMDSIMQNDTNYSALSSKDPVAGQEYLLARALEMSSGDGGEPPDIRTLTNKYGAP